MSEAKQDAPVSRSTRKSDTGSGAADAEASPSLKRSSSSAEGAAESPEEGPKNGKKKSSGATPSKTKKRRKVNHACLYCRRSHMTCDQARPCSRCIKRNIPHLCHDEPRESKKDKLDVDENHVDDSISPRRPPEDAHAAALSNNMASGALLPPDAHRPDMVVGPATADAEQAAAFADNNQLYNDWTTTPQTQLQDMQNVHPNYMFNTSEVTNEYNLLGDFLSNSLLDDGAFYQGGDPQMQFTDPSLANIMGPVGTPNPMFAPNTPLPQPIPLPQPAEGNAAPKVAVKRSADKVDKAQERYYMTAADPAGTEPPEERMHKLLKAKYDAGLLKPFNYVKGYARLNRYMEKNLHSSARKRILQQLDRFRPKFRERMQSLTDMELVIVEMWFEKKLMEYDRVFASMAIPACCWRRTGEIFRGNREMSELIGVPVERLRDGKLSIHEIIAEESLVLYWEKFGAIAFDSAQKGILTSCSLKSPNPENKAVLVQCCFSFTIQRDPHSIPALIIGNFLPVTKVLQ